MYFRIIKDDPSETIGQMIVFSVIFTLVMFLFDKVTERLKSKVK